MSKGRLVWLDVLKGFLILLVIIGHAIQYCLPEGVCEQNYWWNLIYSFHMPAFMAASGYINYRPISPLEKWGGVNLCKRRSYQLLIPFLMWSLIKWGISSSHSFSSLIGLTFNNGGFYWFLWALWIITMISIGCNYVSYKFKFRQEIIYLCVVCILTLCMIAFNIRIFGFQYIAYYFIFYSLGYFLNKNRYLLTNNAIAIGLCFIGWFVLASYWNMHELPWFLNDILLIPASILQYMYRFTTAIIAVYILFSAFPLIFKNKRKMLDGIIYLGLYSLAIYGLQGVLIYYVCDFVIRSNIFHSSLSQILGSFVVTTILCALLVNIGNRNAYSARLLFGKLR